MVALGLALALSITGLILGFVVGRYRRLQAELVRYRDCSHDLLATIDRGGRLTSVNVAWERALGHTVESIRKGDLIELVHRDERTSVRVLLGRAADDGGVSIESRNRFRTADGKYRWLEWEASDWRA